MLGVENKLRPGGTFSGIRMSTGLGIQHTENVHHLLQDVDVGMHVVLGG